MCRQSDSPIPFLNRLEFGSYHDNFEALLVARNFIELGEAQHGWKILIDLRAHILSNNEVKSSKWILPEVEALLQRLASSLLDATAA